MPWRFEYTENFLEKALGLTHEYQKTQVREAIEKVKGLKHPKDWGGQYGIHWAYCICGRRMLLSKISEESKTVRFFDIAI